MTNKEKELIKDNLRAYNANFKYIKIVSSVLTYCCKLLLIYSFTYTP